eukprot:CAMPEP_0184684278 /NCGR_PEP_ID=MMETSP0312-20130426/14609_1 /TAXON_ID=31354 /ORGANISM="Compsopogon coeruleus, Strain SAG 36.94" /LENGTH=51 /DNA_ID=CAMNT_0027137297 /DNA_START=107 /DNA_END=262 /DNA_ORIENTATION=-
MSNEKSSQGMVENFILFSSIHFRKNKASNEVTGEVMSILEKLEALYIKIND